METDSKIKEAWQTGSYRKLVVLWVLACCIVGGVYKTQGISVTGSMLVENPKKQKMTAAPSVLVNVYPRPRL
jgi:hypothetical protein